MLLWLDSDDFVNAEPMRDTFNKWMFGVLMRMSSQFVLCRQSKDKTDDKEEDEFDDSMMLNEEQIFWVRCSYKISDWHNILMLDAPFSVSLWFVILIWMLLQTLLSFISSPKQFSSVTKFKFILALICIPWHELFAEHVTLQWPSDSALWYLFGQWWWWGQCNCLLPHIICSNMDHSEH